MMPSKKQLISDLGEKKLINRIIKRTKDLQSSYFFKDPKINYSLGDDAALIDLSDIKNKDNFLVLTSDMLLEKSHFPSQMTAQDRGWKIVTVNVSDIAAMGAIPHGLILSMGLPPDMELSYFDDLIEGILEACKYYQLPLVGGDTNESSQLVLSGTVIGSVEKSKAMLKTGAREGDLLAVTGDLGLAAAGFEILFSSHKQQDRIKEIIPELHIQKFIKHAIKPQAKLKEGIIAANSDKITAATDISDGLVSELEEIIKAAKKTSKTLGVRIWEEKIPITPELKKLAKYFKIDPLSWALYYGEDFELLFSIKKDSLEFLKDKINLIVLGEVTSTGFMEIVNKKGETKILTPGGYQHLGG